MRGVSGQNDTQQIFRVGQWKHVAWHTALFRVALGRRNDVDGSFRRAGFSSGSVCLGWMARVNILKLAGVRSRAARTVARARVAAMARPIVGYAIAKRARACRAVGVGFVLGVTICERAPAHPPRCEWDCVSRSVARVSDWLGVDDDAVSQCRAVGKSAAARFEHSLGRNVLVGLFRYRRQCRVCRTLFAFALFGTRRESIICDEPCIQWRAAMFTAHPQFVRGCDAVVALRTKARIAPLQNQQDE